MGNDFDIDLLVTVYTSCAFCVPLVFVSIRRLSSHKLNFS